jgi:homogentisate 1,2-dioxygenase
MNAINVEAAKPSQARLQYQLGFASDDHSPFDVVAWRGNHAPVSTTWRDSWCWVRLHSITPSRRSIVGYHRRRTPWRVPMQTL